MPSIKMPLSEAKANVAQYGIPAAEAANCYKLYAEISQWITEQFKDDIPVTIPEILSVINSRTTIGLEAKTMLAWKISTAMPLLQTHFDDPSIYSIEVVE